MVEHRPYTTVCGRLSNTSAKNGCRCFLQALITSTAQDFSYAALFLGFAARRSIIGYLTPYAATLNALETSDACLIAFVVGTSADLESVARVESVLHSLWHYDSFERIGL